MRIDKAHVVVRGVAGTVFPADGTAYGVKVGAGGSIIYSDGTSCDGVIVTHPLRASYGTATRVGERVDLLRVGEIVEYNGPGSAGDAVYAGTGGVLTATEAGNTKIGVIMDGGKRLVVDI